MENSFTFEHVQSLRGYLDTLEVVPSIPAVKTVVMLHGYGANAADLFPLFEVLGIQNNKPLPIHWVFPNAPIELNPRMFGPGRAWFELDIERLQKEMAKKDPSELNLAAPVGIKPTRRHLDELIGLLLEKCTLDQLFLGGFSQGSMMALDAVMRRDDNIGGLALLSTGAFDATEWEKRAPLHAGQRYFQSHGQQDSILAFGSAQRVNKILQKAGWRGSLQPFVGGHEIPPKTLVQLNQFLIA